jgi:hypothetical protein
VAVSYTDHFVLGVLPDDMSYDLKIFYLEIHPDALRVSPAHGSTAYAGIAGLIEFSRMRLKILPKKGDLRDLNNLCGIMFIEAASKLISMVIDMSGVF